MTAHFGLLDHEVQAELRRRCEVSTQKALARELAVSLSGLNEVITGRRAPYPKLLKALGLIRVSIYVKDKAFPRTGRNAAFPRGRG